MDVKDFADAILSKCRELEIAEGICLSFVILDSKENKSASFVVMNKCEAIDACALTHIMASEINKKVFRYGA